MKLNDIVFGIIVGFRYGFVNNSNVCFIDIKIDEDTQHSAILGNADAYPFGAMLTLKGQATKVKAVCTNEEKQYLGQVTFEV